MGFFLDWFQNLNKSTPPAPAKKKPAPQLAPAEVAKPLHRSLPMEEFDVNATKQRAGIEESTEHRLQALFWNLNFAHFGGILPPLDIFFSARLKTTGGQYHSKPRRKIQISTRYFEGINVTEPGITSDPINANDPWAQIRDTLGHELVHYWLDFRGRPCGHTPEFTRKLRECGFSRYSGLIPPKTKIIYECPRCEREYYRKRAGVWSCGRCSGKAYNAAFQLRVKQRLG